MTPAVVAMHRTLVTFAESVGLLNQDLLKMAQLYSFNMVSVYLLKLSLLTLKKNKIF